VGFLAGIVPYRRGARHARGRAAQRCARQV